MRCLVPVSAAALTLGATLTLGAAGCAAEPPPRAASGSGTVILQTHRLAGLMGTPEQVDPPEVTVYGDGRTIVEEDGEGPLPRLTEYRATPEQIRAVFAEAADAGLFEGGRLPAAEEVADGGTLRIVIRSERGVRTTEVASPGVDAGGARGAAIEFADGLPSALRSDDPARRPRPYRAERLGVYVERESDPPQEVRDWPSAPLVARVGRDAGCLTLRGKEAVTVTRAAEAAPADTIWREDGTHEDGTGEDGTGEDGTGEGGTTFRAWFRPLLPHEADCRAALVRP